ncbi:tautomerase family protein, partial [Amycolatopsis sp. NPDC059027]|uniref:tautomerase family protein n=1 Tax=Amycolatopsis sp. NPDC059027 TaxID=3346709 RepID=UPI00366C78FF
MPFANLKVPAGTLTAESKKKLQDAVTDAVAGRYRASAPTTPPVFLGKINPNRRSPGGPN